MIWYVTELSPKRRTGVGESLCGQGRVDLHRPHVGMQRGKACDVPRRRSRLAEDEVRIDLQPVDRPGACRGARPWRQGPVAVTGSSLAVNDVSQLAPPSIAHDMRPDRDGMSTFNKTSNLMNACRELAMTAR